MTAEIPTAFNADFFILFFSFTKGCINNKDSTVAYSKAVFLLAFIMLGKPEPKIGLMLSMLPTLIACKENANISMVI